MEQNKSRFPEQDEPEKMHGTTDENGQTPKMSTNVKKTDKNESAHLTDRSGEEEKEDYINTDERKRDLERRGL